MGTKLPRQISTPLGRKQYRCSRRRRHLRRDHGPL